MSQYIFCTEELAKALGVPPRTIREHRAGVRHSAVLAGLPEPLPGTRPLRWLRADIEAWLDSRRTFRPASEPPAAPPTEPPKRPRGRPRKNAGAGEKGGVA